MFPDLRGEKQKHDIIWGKKKISKKKLEIYIVCPNS